MKFHHIIVVFVMCTLRCFSGEMISCPSAQDPPLINSSMAHIKERYTDLYESFNLTCTAAYPIEWDFDGDLPNADAIVTRTRHSLRHSSCYESILEIDTHEDFSTTFICSSIKDPIQRRSSFHIFFAGDTGAIFSTSIPQKVKRAERTKEGQFVIPCRSNYEHVNVTLMKILNETESPVTLLNSSVTYDPKVGFLFKSSEPVIGKYKCLASSDSNVYSTIHAKNFEREIEILATEDTVSYSPESEFPSFEIGSGLHIVCESVNEIYLNTTGVPKEFISRASTAHIPGSKFPYAAEILINSTGNAKGQVSCHRKDTNALVTTWKFDEENRCQCIWDNWLRKKSGDLLDPNGIFSCSPGSKIDPRFVHCRSPSECRLHQSVIKDDCLVKDCYIFLHFGPYSSQLLYHGLRCDVQVFNLTESKSLISTRSSTSFEKFPGVVYNIFRTLDKDDRSENLISIKPENSRRVFRASESYEFVCKYHSNFLVRQILWGVKMKNGSLTYVNENKDSKRRNRDSYSSGYYGKQETNIIQIPDMDIDSVYCFATVWATGEILNSSFRIRVHEPAVIVDDPQNCAGISDHPSIVWRKRNSAGSFTFYNVTGTDFVADYDTYMDQSKLICVSTHMTEWTFNGENFSTPIQTPSSYSSKSHGLVTKEMLGVPHRSPNDPQFCFINSITIHLSSSSMIGNYTCRELRKYGEESSVYLFVKQADSRFNLIGHGTHETLAINKSQEWTALPCRASDPDVEIHLIRQDYEGNMYALSRVLNSSYLKPYDPKQGYFIKTILLYTVYNESDLYICSSVQKGVEDKEVNHVKSYGLRFEEIVTKTEEEEGNDENIESKLFPWLCVLLLLFLTVIPGICLYNWKLRKELKTTRATTTVGSVLYINNDNNVPKTEPYEGTDYELSLKARDTDGGVTNLGYSQFK